VVNFQEFQVMLATGTHAHQRMVTLPGPNPSRRRNKRQHLLVGFIIHHTTRKYQAHTQAYTPLRELHTFHPTWPREFQLRPPAVLAL